MSSVSLFAFFFAILLSACNQKLPVDQQSELNQRNGSGSNQVEEFGWMAGQAPINPDEDSVIEFSKLGAELQVPKGTFDGQANVRAGTADPKEFPGLPPTATNSAASAALKIEITDENGKLKSVDEMNGPIEIALDTFGVKPEDLDQYSMLIVINPDDSGKSEKLTIPSEALALNTNVTPATVSFYLKATSFVAMLIKTSEVPKSYKPKFDDADADGIADINDVCPTSTNNETSIRYKDADSDGIFAASAEAVCVDDAEYTVAANELTIEQKTNLDPIDVAPEGTTAEQRAKPTLSYTGANSMARFCPKVHQWRDDEL